MFFYCGCIAGPAYDYYEYDEFMDLKGVYSNPPPHSAVKKETLKLVRNGVIMSLILVFLGKSFPLEFCG
jgi:lysophospholipid acyltransferase